MSATARGVIGYLIRRLLLAAVTMWAISVVAFAVIQLPPVDFVDSYISKVSAAGGGAMTPEQVQLLRSQLGADQPRPVQYLKWISRVLQGDFGFTLEYQRPVSEVIGDRLALTIVVSVASLLVTWAVALPVGVYTAMRPRSVGYYLATGFTSLGLALPGFLLGLIVLFVGFVAFGLDVGGLFSADYVAAPWSVGRALDLLEHLPVPAVVLAVSGSAQAVRILRANLLDELHKPYVLSARARGLSELQTVIRHPLRVALVPFASMVGSTLPSIVSGSIIVSLVLGLPTVGPLLLKALIATDLYLAGAIVLLLGALTVVGTFLSDVLVMWLDPRVRPGSV